MTTSSTTTRSVSTKQSIELQQEEQAMQQAASCGTICEALGVDPDAHKWEEKKCSK